MDDSHCYQNTHGNSKTARLGIPNWRFNVWVSVEEVFSNCTGKPKWWGGSWESAIECEHNRWYYEFKEP